MNDLCLHSQKNRLESFRQMTGVCNKLTELLIVSSLYHSLPLSRDEFSEIDNILSIRVDEIMRGTNESVMA